MSFQEYIIHLNNGMVISMDENFDLPFSKGIVERYRKAKDNDYITLGDCINGFIYVLKKNIAYISTGDVKVVNK